MELHHLPAALYIGSLTDAAAGITAFSALPNAPVLDAPPTRRHRLAAAVRSLTVRAPRPAPTRRASAFAADGAADGVATTRMAECRV